VSDTGGNRLEVFAAGSYAFAEQWAPSGGVPSVAGFTSPTGFSSPAGIAVDPHGSVYVADEGHGRIVRLWGEGAFLGELGGASDLGGAGLADADAVAVGGQFDQTYVADAAHNRVLVYSPGGTLVAQWGAGGAVITQWGSKGTGNGRFNTPTALAVSAAGDVYVLDRENNRVQEFDAGGHFLAKWGLRGTGPGEFSQPNAIAVGCEGDVYVADTNNNRVEGFQLAAPATSGCLAPGTWPTPLNIAPLVHVSLPRAGGVLARRALTLAVSCLRSCKVLVTGTLTPLSRRGRAVALVGAARALTGGLTADLRLLVSARGLRLLRGELGHHRRLEARVSIVAAAPTGARATVTRSFLVTR
jgi:tripartite motif-containing protein 71